MTIDALGPTTSSSTWSDTNTRTTSIKPYYNPYPEPMEAHTTSDQNRSLLQPHNAAILVWPLGNGFMVRLPDGQLFFAATPVDMTEEINKYYGKLALRIQKDSKSDMDECDTSGA